MNRKIRWGLLGAGKILDRWMKGACQIDDMEIVAVAPEKVLQRPQKSFRYRKC